MLIFLKENNPYLFSDRHKTSDGTVWAQRQGFVLILNPL